jgi:hypothetical protein
MGWNNWDAYGTTVGEEQVKANALDGRAHFKQDGWQYVVVDMEWFVTNPKATPLISSTRSMITGAIRLRRTVFHLLFGERGSGRLLLVSTQRG